MGDYYMTKHGAKRYKRSMIGTFVKQVNAEKMAERARKAHFKGVTVKEGRKHFRDGYHKVYRVYINR